MARGAARPKMGTKEAPVEISSSSSQPGTANASPALSQDLESSTASRSTASSRAREPWTMEETTELVKLLKDNIHYQVMFLPGHNKNHTNKTGPAQKAAMLRSMRDHIFGETKSKTGDGVKSKINSTVERYRHFLQAMSITGQGLLLEDMYDGPIKNAREQLLAKCPWWEDMHLMMRDRNSSDPSKVVTGAGEIKSKTNATGKDDSLEIFSEDDDDEEAGNVGLGLSQAATRAKKRGFDYDYDEDADEDMDDQMEFDNTQSTPRASTSGSSSSLRLPSHSLPQMSRLVDAANKDPMGKGSVRKGAADKQSPASSSSDKSIKDDKGKGVDRSDITGSGSKSPTKQGKSNVSDQAMDDFGRYLVEDREQRSQATAEKERTKRLRLELKSQDREKDIEVLDRRLDTLANKLEAIHMQTNSNAQAISQLTNSINTFMNKVDIMTMILQHISPGTASGSGSVRPSPL
ncbi:hypothetical protein CF319_g3465 [Tilletia indica]|nr:hypothetical protein CF319_g3465 [Tilletia indica]